MARDAGLFLDGVHGAGKAGNLAGGVFPMHGFPGIFAEYGRSGHQSGRGGCMVVVLHGSANGFHDVFDAGTGSPVTGGALLALSVAL